MRIAPVCSMPVSLRLSFKRITLIVLFLSMGVCYAQQGKARYFVSGELADAETGKPLEYVTVMGADTEGRAAASAISGEDGRFSMAFPKDGPYLVVISPMGYRPETRNIEISGRETVDLGTIMFTPGVEIEEVVVSAPQLLRREVDRLVYDVSSDPDAARMKMSEIMAKIPELAMGSGKGRLEYGGEEINQIMISGGTDELVNGRRQYTMEFIRADVMKTIELILPGSSEYDNAKPIINIVLERPLPFGVAGEFAANASTAGSYSPSADIVTKNRLMTIGANYTFGYKDTPHLGIVTERENLISGAMLPYQSGESHSWSQGKSHNISLGVAVPFLNEKLTLRLNANTSKSDIDNFTESANRYYDAGGELISGHGSSARTNSSSPMRLNGRAAVSYSLGYMQSLNLEYNYSDSRTATCLYRSQSDLIAGTDAGSSRTGSATGSIQHRAGGNVNLSFGEGSAAHKLFAAVYYYNRKYENSSQYYEYDPKEGDYVVVEESRYGLEYTQSLVTGRVAYTPVRKIGPVNYALGLRAEYISNRGVFLSTGNTPLDYSEFNLLPNVSLLFNKKRHHGRLLYNTRVMRPSVEMLNPYVDESDPANVRAGNPGLRGEYAHKGSVSYGYRSPGFFGNITIMYGAELVNNAIERITTINADNTALTTYGNLGRVFKQQAEIRWMPQIFRSQRNIIVFTGGYSRSLYTFSSGGKNVVEGFTFAASLPNFTLWNNGPELRLSFSMAPSFSSAQSMTTRYYSSLDFGIMKYFRKIKLGGEITVTDALHGRKFLQETTGSETYIMNVRRERLGRTVSINIYWRFGRFDDKDRVGKAGPDAYDMSRPALFGQ